MPGDNHKYNVALSMVDAFTNYTEVIPLKDKTEGSLLSGLMEGFNKMGATPITVYSDDEPALSSTYTEQAFNEQHITFFINTNTRCHS